MIGDMAEHTHNIRLKSHELALEKRRSDALLYQMMPRSVADQLKAQILSVHFREIVHMHPYAKYKFVALLVLMICLTVCQIL